MINELFLFGNIVLLFGTILLIREVVKNRNALRGYSLFGSFLTLVATISFEIAYLLLGFLSSFLLSLLTVFYWFFVTFYLLLKRRRKWR